MATETDHRHQASHNQIFLDSIDQAIFPDWAVTAAFYKAVHVVQTLLVRKGQRSDGHRERNAILKRKFATVWSHYRPLYNQSRVARYWCVAIPSGKVAQAIARLRAVESAVAAIP